MKLKCDLCKISPKIFFKNPKNLNFGLLRFLDLPKKPRFFEAIFQLCTACTVGKKQLYLVDTDHNSNQ